MISVQGSILLFGFASILLLSHKRDQMRRLTRGMQLRQAHNGRQYYVRAGPTAKNAAMKLALVEEATDRLLLSIATDGPAPTKQLREDIRTLLIRLRGKRIELMELNPKPDEPVAVNYGKGTTIKLCLYDSESGRPADTEALLTVMVHELAHVMEPMVSKLVDGHSIHTERFKTNERYLMRKAAELSMISDGGTIGQPYCGITLPDPGQVT